MFALFAYVSAPETYGEGFRLVSARQIFRVSSPCLFRLSPSWEIREIWRANEKDVNEGTDWLSEWRRLGRMIRENKYSYKHRESFRQAVVASLKILTWFTESRKFPQLQLHVVARRTGRRKCGTCWQNFYRSISSSSHTLSHALGVRMRSCY